MQQLFYYAPNFVFHHSLYCKKISQSRLSTYFVKITQCINLKLRTRKPRTINPARLLTRSTDSQNKSFRAEACQSRPEIDPS